MLLPKKNDEIIKEFTRRPEGLLLDFKLHITNPAKLAKTLTAFANTDGGTVVIGVSDKKELVGIDPEEELYMVEKSSTDYCNPPVAVDFELFETDIPYGIEEKKEIYILMVHVRKSETPHYYLDHNGKKTLYKRVYDRTIPVSEQ
jgi:predicted HTH transcriptional regulator